MFNRVSLDHANDIYAFMKSRPDFVQDVDKKGAVVLGTFGGRLPGEHLSNVGNYCENATFRIWYEDKENKMKMELKVKIRTWNTGVDLSEGPKGKQHPAYNYAYNQVCTASLALK